MAETPDKKIETFCGINVLRLRPPKIALALVLISLAVHFAWGKSLSQLYFNPVLGAVIIICGFSLMLWAWAIFRKRKTTFSPTASASECIECGAFRFTRNPMYLGMIALMVGIALLIGTWPLFIAPLFFFALLNGIFIPFEERKMETIFGKRYNNYRSRVRRWI